jgi:hypothetical protein
MAADANFEINADLDFAVTAESETNIQPNADEGADDASAVPGTTVKLEITFSVEFTAKPFASNSFVIRTDFTLIAS